MAYRQLVKAAQDFKPDFIYERYNLFLLSGTLLKRKLGIPLLLEVNAPLVDERLKHSGGLSLNNSSLAPFDKPSGSACLTVINKITL